MHGRSTFITYRKENLGFLGVPNKIGGKKYKPFPLLKFARRGAKRNFHGYFCGRLEISGSSAHGSIDIGYGRTRGNIDMRGIFGAFPVEFDMLKNGIRVASMRYLT